MGNVYINEDGKTARSKATGFKAHLTPKNIKRGLVVLAVLAVGVLVWQYMDARAELKRYNDPAAAVAKESEDTVSEVGKVMVLPTGEQPIPALVKDEAKFADNPVFEGVKNGDKLLIYQEKRKVIIYRPSTKQIVNVITIAANQEVPAQ